jgi:hypothetical protein
MTWDDKILVGWREWVALPVLGLPAIKAKVDTGARTTALHAFQVDAYWRRGRHHVRFALHPLRHRPELVVTCNAEVIDRRIVSDSGGHREKRYVILTPLRLAGREWPVEVTLSRRDSMLFRMLLGRTAMEGYLIVDPERSYVHGRGKTSRLYRPSPKTHDPEPPK